MTGRILAQRRQAAKERRKRRHGRIGGFCGQVGLTLIEVAVLVLMVGCVGFVLLINMHGHGWHHQPAHRIRCANNLKQIYTFAAVYADRGDGLLPLASGSRPPAHESLNEMLSRHEEGWHSQSELFVCPKGEATSAEMDGGRNFRLETHTLSYAWITQPVKWTERKPLASDKYVDGYEDEGGTHSGHEGGMNVLFTDGSVRWVPVVDLPVGMLPEGLGR